LKPIDPNAAVDFIIEHAPKIAQAKAERVYLEEFRKSKKAVLMQVHNDKPIGAQEREAYAHPEYIGLLAALQVAVEREENLKWMMTAAQTRVDVWRSQESTARAQDRAAT
jgi:hypothetical protein